MLQYSHYEVTTGNSDLATRFVLLKNLYSRNIIKKMFFWIISSGTHKFITLYFMFVLLVIFSEEECYKKVLWQDVRPGDIVQLKNNEVIPADILVLKCSDPQGLCYIDTCNLDGESNLKQRQVASCFMNMVRKILN